MISIDAQTNCLKKLANFTLLIASKRIQTVLPYADPSSYLESGALELTFIDPEESLPDEESTQIENPKES